MKIANNVDAVIDKRQILWKTGSQLLLKHSDSGLILSIVLPILCSS